MAWKGQRPAAERGYEAVKELVWFNISVMYSSVCAGLAAGTVSDTARIVLVLLAVHGALWAIYRAIALVVREQQSDTESNPSYEREE